MRIAFDYQTFVLQSYGGISRYFTRLAQGLLAADQEVHIFASLYRNAYLSTLPKEMVTGRYITRYPPMTRRIVTAYNRRQSGIHIANWKPDIVHETYYSSACSTREAWPTVTTVHDMIHEQFPHSFLPDDNTVILKKKAVERAGRVICVSECTKLDLMRLYGTPAKKITVVHHGFDHFAGADALPRIEMHDEKPFLLYVGQRDGYKNFGRFLEAVASSPKLRCDFDVIAFGGGQYSKRELDLISSLGFEEDQVQHRSGADAQLAALYRSARAFVYPSLYEGFGIPPLEAMAHHCPVVASNTSAMPEVIAGAGEYFDPTDVGDMRRAIENVVYSDTRVGWLRRAGVERVKEFSWDKCTQETLAVYRSV